MSEDIFRWSQRELYLDNLGTPRECGQSSGEITEGFSDGINSAGENLKYTEVDSLFPFVFMGLSAKPSGKRLVGCVKFWLWVFYLCENSDRLSSQISNKSN